MAIFRPTPVSVDHALACDLTHVLSFLSWSHEQYISFGILKLPPVLLVDRDL